MVLSKCLMHGMLKLTHISKGFIKAVADSNLYVIIHEDKILVLVLYVDDLLFTGNCSQWIDWSKAQIEDVV
jgi:hypothetical protein